MPESERIYIIGGTGNIGTAVVKNLLKKQVPVTLYARSPAKAQGLFGSDTNLAIVEGDLENLKPFEESIGGHARLFLLVADFVNLTKTTTAIAKTAYAAGVKQIVHITSGAVNLAWRSSYIGDGHRQSEEALAALPNRGAYVTLRPFIFMTNMLRDIHSIKNGILTGIVDPDQPQEWISTNDIGLAAANILQDSIEKHADAAYELVGEVLTSKERAAVFSKVLGKTITYKKISAQELYNIMTTAAGAPHLLALSIMNLPTLYGTPTPGLPVILGREPETLEQWLEENKKHFL